MSFSLENSCKSKLNIYNKSIITSISKRKKKEKEKIANPADPDVLIGLAAS